MDLSYTYNTFDEKSEAEAAAAARDVRQQQLMLLQGGIRQNVRCSTQVMQRIWRLMTLPGRQTRMQVFWWFLALAIVGVYSYVNYQMSLQGGEFLTILSNYGALDYGTNSTDDNCTCTQTQGYCPPTDERQALHDARHEFMKVFVKVLFYTIGAAILYSYMLTVSQWLGQCWRQHISDYIFDKYFFQNVFYEVNFFEKSLDNVDIRIATDVRLFSTWFANFLFGTVYYNGILPTLSTAAAFTYLLATTAGSLGLWVSYISFVFFVSLNSLLGSWVATAAYSMDTDNGFYMHAQTHLRLHAEHVAFYRGQKEERAKLSALLDDSQKSTGTFIRRTFFLNFSTNLYYWMAAVLNYALPGLIFFLGDGDKSPSRVNRLLAVTAYNYYLQTTFSYSIYVSEAWAYTMSYATRVAELLERLDKRFVDAEARKLNGSHYKDADHIELRHVMCRTPDDLVLVKDLNMKTAPRESLIIMGPSGAGKSSILRMICGLWPIKQGEILCPSSADRGVFFLPQRPYLTLGTLREQFFYPKSASDSLDLSDNQLRVLLRQVDLEYLLERFNPTSVADWANTLSVGEQQRIGMARLFYHRPQFAILDESTSAVDAFMEEKFYKRCRDLQMTYISVAHRNTCIKYHDVLLKLDGKGGYSVEAVAALLRNGSDGSARSRSPSSSPPPAPTVVVEDITPLPDRSGNLGDQPH